MATESQIAAVNKLVENGGKSVSKAMREAKLKNGKNAYSIQTAKNPSKLTDSVGFMELCEEAGLTDEFLLEALHYDIKAKKKNRKPELELAFKIKGKMIERTDLTSGGEKITALTEIQTATKEILNGKDKTISKEQV